MSAPAFFHIQAYAVPAGSSKSSTDSSSVGTVAQRRERSITAAAATASRSRRMCSFPLLYKPGSFLPMSLFSYP